jgi:hypothetical protein
MLLLVAMYEAPDGGLEAEYTVWFWYELILCYEGRSVGLDSCCNIRIFSSHNLLLNQEHVLTVDGILELMKGILLRLFKLLLINYLYGAESLRNWL